MTTSIPTTVIKKIIAALNWKGKDETKIRKAKYIVEKLTGNTDFPLPWAVVYPTLAAISAQIVIVDAAKTLAESKALGAAEAFQAQLGILQGMLMDLMPMVQKKMETNPANAEAVCLGAGYDVKRITIRGKRQDTAKSTEEGVVALTGAGKGGHQWQQSPDNGTTIIQLDPTSSGKTIVTDLPSGAKMWFRNRTVLTKGRFGDWSQWIYVRVK
jgi:hypothetical protein